jgi:hypothetical protein
MKIAGTLPAYPDVVSASVILERDMERLVYIADPMTKKFQGDQSISVAFGS